MRRRPWTWFSTITLAGFVFINGFFWYLSTRIVPFEARVPFDQTGYSQTFQLCCFQSADYVLMLSIDHPERDSVTMLKDWERTERELRAAFDITLALELRDKAGNVVITHQGGLDDWKLTNSAPREGADGGFCKYRFDAHLLETYQLKVDVLKGNAGTKAFNPTLLFRGVDDGYLWLAYLLYNVLWGVVALVALVIGLVVHFVRRKHAT